MSLLAQLRRTGARVELGQSDSIDLDPVERVPRSLLAQAVERKGELLATLRAEAFGGTLYSSSALFLQVDDVFSSVKRLRDKGCAVDACNRVMQMIHGIEMSDSLSDIQSRIAAERQTFIDAISQIVAASRVGLLEGSELHALALDVFDVRHPVAADPQPLSLDLSAFAPVPPSQLSLTGAGQNP